MNGRAHRVFLAATLLASAHLARAGESPTPTPPPPATPKAAAPAAASTPAPAAESATKPAAERFVDLFEPFRTERAALSPDGKFLAYSVREGETLSIVIVEIDNPAVAKARVTVATDTTSTPAMSDKREKIPAAIRWMGWATPTRLVVETNTVFAFTDSGEWRSCAGVISAMDADGGNARTLVSPRDVEELKSAEAGIPATGGEGEALARPTTPRSPHVFDFAPGEPAGILVRAEQEATPLPPPEPSPTPGGISRPDQPPPPTEGASSESTDADDPLATQPAAIPPPTSIIVRADGASRFSVFSVNVETGKMRDVSDEILDPEMRVLVDRRSRPRIAIPQTTKFSFPHRFTLETRAGVRKTRDLDQLLGFTGSAGFSLSPENFFGSRAVPVGFDENPDVFYFASNIGRDTYGIYSFDLKSGNRTGLAVENPHFDLIAPDPDGFPDPDTLVFDRFSRKLIGIRFEGRTRTTAWLRPEWQEAQAVLEKLLTGRSVEIQEWNATGTRFLVLARRPADAGAFYIFDRDTAKLAEFVRRAPWLDAKNTHRTVVFNFDNPAGGQINGVLTIPKASRLRPIPIVVLCSPRPWERMHAEFSAGVEAVADMGFAVVQINGRGAWGFGTKQREAVAGGFEEPQIADVVFAIEQLAKRFTIDPKRVAIMGEQLGGFLAVRALQLQPERFRCAVAIEAPMDLAGMIEEARWNDGRTGPALTRGFLGDKARLKETSPLRHTDEITKPVFLLNYPGKPGEPPNGNYLAARRLAAAVRKQAGSEFFELAEDYVENLPRARADAFRRIEDFLNLNIYDYKVELGPMKVLSE